MCIFLIAYKIITYNILLIPQNIQATFTMPHLIVLYLPGLREYLIWLPFTIPDQEHITIKSLDSGYKLITTIIMAGVSRYPDQYV